MLSKLRGKKGKKGFTLIELMNGIMRNDFDNPADLIHALDAAIRDQRWRVILESFLPMGLSTTRHVQDATGFARDSATRCLDQLEGFFLEGSPLILRHEHPLRVPGGSKRPSTIFLLSEASARSLRHLGLEARACELKDDTPILHAICMQSITNLAARQSEIQIITDRNLYYAGDRQIRPDHQITLADGSGFLMEIEQQGTPKVLPRIIESLSHTPTSRLPSSKMPWIVLTRKDPSPRISPTRGE